MNAAGAPGDRTLKVELELHLDRQPMTGVVHTQDGVEHPFVGWLGFLGVLDWLQARSEADETAAAATDD